MTARQQPDPLQHAIDWAHSAHGCYARADRAQQEADRQAPAPLITPAPEVRTLLATAAYEYRNAQIETGLANAWATIALATKEDAE